MAAKPADVTSQPPMGSPASRHATHVSAHTNFLHVCCEPAVHEHTKIMVVGFVCRGWVCVSSSGYRGQSKGRTLSSVKAGRHDDQRWRELRCDGHQHTVERRQVVRVTLSGHILAVKRQYCVGTAVAAC